LDIFLAQTIFADWKIIPNGEVAKETSLLLIIASNPLRI